MYVTLLPKKLGYFAVKKTASVKIKLLLKFVFSAQLVRNWENFSRKKLFKITFYMGLRGRIIGFQNTWVSKNFLKFQQHRNLTKSLLWQWLFIDQSVQNWKIFSREKLSRITFYMDQRGQNVKFPRALLFTNFIKVQFLLKWSFIILSFCIFLSFLAFGFRGVTLIDIILNS